MKILKIIAGIIVTLVLLVIVAVSLVILLFDPNDFKPQISQAVKDATQRELVMAGDIEWRFFPWLGVSLNQVSLSNPPDFPAANTTFAEIANAQVEVRLLSLLQSQPDVGTLVLHDTQLNLVRTAEGRTNWEDLIPAATEQPAEPAPEPSGEMVIPNIQGIDFRNATLVWDDQLLGQQFTLSEVDLVTGALALNAPIAVKASAALTSNLLPGSKSNITVTTTTTLNPTAQLFELQPLEIMIAAEGETLPEGSQDIKLDTAVAINLASQELEVGRVLIKAFNSTLDGNVKVTDLQGNPTLTGNLQLMQTNLRQILTQLGQAPNTTDPNTLQKFSFNTTFAATPTRLSIEPLNMVLDESEISGVLHVRDLTTAATELDLRINKLDVDRYLPPVSTTPPPSGEQPPAEQPPTAPTEIPVELLKGLDLNGNVLIQQLKVNNFHINDATLTVSAKNGQLNISPQARFYEGGYAGLVQLDVTSQPPAFRLKNNLQDVQIGAMLQDLMGATPLIGVAQFSTDLGADASSLESLQTSLTGKFDFGIENGAVKGFSIEHALQQVNALIKGQTLAPSNTPLQTDFHSLGGSITAESGVLKSKYIGLKAAGIRAEGQGSLTLVDQSLDILLRAGVVGNGDAQQDSRLDELHGLAIPLKITGSITDPKVIPTLDGVLTEGGRQKLRETLTETLQEKAADLLGDHSETLSAVGEALENPEEARKKIGDLVEQKAADLLGDHSETLNAVGEALENPDETHEKIGDVVEQQASDWLGDHSETLDTVGEALENPDETREKIGDVVEQKASDLLEEHSDTLEEVTDIFKGFPNLFGGSEEDEDDDE